MSTFTSCQSEKKIAANPFFEEWNTPYGIPPFERIRPEHYLPALERAMAEQNAEIDAIASNNDAPTFDNTILAFDGTGRTLEQIALTFGMLCESDNSPEMQQVQEQAMPMFAAHEASIRHNDRLFDRIRTIYDKRKTARYTPEQMRLIEKQYTAFVREGALLAPKEKERLSRINEALTLAEVKFGNNLLAENDGYTLLIEDEKDLIGLPNEVRLQARREAREADEPDGWLFTLKKSSMIPFLTYSAKRDLREQIYTAYLKRCDNDNEYDNGELINELIRLRTEKAHLLGFPSYAEYVLADQMAATPKAAYALLDEIWEPALARAKEELEEMMPLFRRDQPEGDFASWDWWYYAEKLRKQKYDLDEEMLRPYFALENVQGGIFFLANRLYGLTFRPVNVPTYNKEVSSFEVLDQDESLLGILLFDFYTRPGKSQGAWCGNFVEQTYSDKGRVAPVVAVVTNFASPASGNSTLLTTDEVETLFHEFGHALHFLFHDVRYRGLSEVEGDFVELPSQMLENWAFEHEVLRHYATHHRTKEVIPDYLVRKLHRSRLFNQGFMTTELVAAALSDLDIHSIKEYTAFRPDDFEHNALRLRRGLIPQIEPRYRYPYFAHIFAGGYASGYYFYPWAEVLDQDAFEAFRETGDLFNREVAQAFRHKLLARGGEADGMTLYRNFRGKDPDRRALLRSRGLIEEPDSADTETPMHNLRIKPMTAAPIEIQTSRLSLKPQRIYKKESLSEKK